MKTNQSETFSRARHQIQDHLTLFTSFRSPFQRAHCVPLFKSLLKDSKASILKLVARKVPDRSSGGSVICCGSNAFMRNSKRRNWSLVLVSVMCDVLLYSLIFIPNYLHFYFCAETGANLIQDVSWSALSFRKQLLVFKILKTSILCFTPQEFQLPSIRMK